MNRKINKNIALKKAYISIAQNYLKNIILFLYLSLKLYYIYIILLNFLIKIKIKYLILQKFLPKMFFFTFFFVINF